MDENYEGEVLIDNKSIKDLSEKEKDSYRENVFGYVFQKPPHNLRLLKEPIHD